MIEGSCHCGQVKWVYPLALESVTACNCTVCRRYGALWMYGYLEDGIKIQGETKFYERGANIKFHFCSGCGCVTHYSSKKPDSEGRWRVAVNVRMIHNPEKIMNLPIDHFEGYEKFEDLPRDGRNVQHLWF